MAAMHCLTCEHPNSASAKFCEQCGSALNLRLCVKCEAVNDSKAARCHSCEAPLASARALPRRRTLVALAAAGVVGVGFAAGALYLLDRKPLEAATQARVAPTAAAPAERSEPAPKIAEPPAKAKPAEPPAKARPVARTVTHTRATPAAPSAPAAPAPVAAPPIASENAPPPITHTRRAVVTPDTKTGSN